MYRLLFIAGRNLRKKKNDAVILICLIALSVLMLYISISVLTRIGDVVQEAYDKGNTADFYYASGYPGNEEVLEALLDQEETAEAEATPVLYIPGVDYQGEKDEKSNNFMFMLGDVDEERKICSIYPDAPKDMREDDIILPYYLKSAFSYEEGDWFWMKLGNHTYQFHVRGFVEDPLFATPINIGIYKCYVSGEYLEKIKEQEPELGNSVYWEYKVRLKDGYPASEFEEKVTPILMSEIPGLSGGVNYGFNWETMSVGITMASNIGMGLLLVFAVLLLIIALIVVRFCIRNFIEMNLKNIGVLKASGYTSRQLIGSTLLEMGMLAIPGAAAGLAAGFLCAGFVGGLEAAILGLQWNQGLDGRAAIISSGTVILVIALIAFLGSRIYRKIMVLDALRGGISSHNFRKNYFPLERTRQPLTLALGMKSIFGAKLKNLGILCIVTILSLTSCIGFAMYENFARNQDGLLKLVGIELGDVIVTGANLEDAGKKIEDWTGVRKVNSYISTNISIEYGDHTVSVSCDGWQEPEQVENEVLLWGRFPEYENEIVVTDAVARELGAELGDIVSVSGTGEAKDFMIVGIDQKINNMGRKAMAGFEGLTYLNGNAEVMQLCVYAGEEYTAGELMEHIKREFPELETTDSAKSAENSLSIIILVMKLLCTLFVGVTIITTFLAVLLLVKSKLIRERRDYGVYKAIGFTSGELMRQTILGVVPLIAAGAVLGAVGSVFITEPFVGLCMTTVGITKCSLYINPWYLVLTVLIIVLVAFGTILPNAFKIRRIEPVKMLMEE